MASKTKRGKILYDGQWGHVCTCSEREYPAYGEGGLRINDYYHVTYDNSGTESSRSQRTGGSYWYFCERCGAGTWSGL